MSTPTATTNPAYPDRMAYTPQWWTARDRPAWVRPIVRRWRLAVTADPDDKRRFAVTAGVVTILALPVLTFLAWFVWVYS